MFGEACGIWNGREASGGADRKLAKLTFEAGLAGAFELIGSPQKDVFDGDTAPSCPSSRRILGPGDADLLATVMGAIFPSASLKDAGLTEATAKPIADALKDSMDQSLAIAMNASWSAGINEEAALVYTVALDGGDESKTDAAIEAALIGG